MIEFLNHGNELTISLKANDVSLFEMNINQYNSLLKENFDFHNPINTDLLRTGPDMYRIPFLYRSIFRMNNNDIDQIRVYKDTTLLANNKIFGYIFDISLILSQNTTDDIALFKSVSFFIDFYKINKDKKIHQCVNFSSILFIQ
jgi:hypothetical protein